MRLPLPVANLARRLREGALRAGDINAFLDIEAETSRTVPLPGGEYSGVAAIRPPSSPTSAGVVQPHSLMLAAIAAI